MYSDDILDYPQNVRQSSTESFWKLYNLKLLKFQ